MMCHLMFGVHRFHGPATGATRYVTAQCRLRLPHFARMPAGQNTTGLPEMTESSSRAVRCGGTQTRSPDFYLGCYPSGKFPHARRWFCKRLWGNWTSWRGPLRLLMKPLFG